jgi:hypothetical protein
MMIAIDADRLIEIVRGILVADGTTDEVAEATAARVVSAVAADMPGTAQAARALQASALRFAAAKVRDTAELGTDRMADYIEDMIEDL